MRTAVDVVLRFPAAPYTAVYTLITIGAHNTIIPIPHMHIGGCQLTGTLSSSSRGRETDLGSNNIKYTSIPILKWS